MTLTVRFVYDGDDWKKVASILGDKLAMAILVLVPSSQKFCVRPGLHAWHDGVGEYLVSQRPATRNVITMPSL